MDTNNLAFINKYVSANNKIETISLQSKDVTQYHQLYRKITKIIADDSSNHLLEKFFPVKQIFFELRSSLENYKTKLDKIFTENDWADILEFLEEFSMYGEGNIELAKKLLAIVNDIRKDKIKNELRDWMVRKCESNYNSRIAIVSSFPEYDLDLIQRFNSITLLKPNELIKNNELYDVVVFLGTPNYYANFDSIFFGKEILYVSYDIYRNEYNKREILNMVDSKTNSIYKNTEIKNSRHLSNQETMSEDSPIKHEIPKSIRDMIAKNSQDDNIVEGRYISLTENRGIVVLKNSGLRVIEIIPGEAIAVKVSWKKISELVPTDKIILTLSTNPEFLENYSKNLLGEEDYDQCLKLISRYKLKLQKLKIQVGGIRNLIKRMKNNDIRVSSIQSVKNWMSMDTIKPRQLDKILKLLNYKPEDVQRTIVAAKKINSTNIRAGRHKSKNIEKILNRIPIEDAQFNKTIFSDNPFEFQIQQLGVFSIETVTSVSEEKLNIPRNELYKLRKFR